MKMLAASFKIILLFMLSGLFLMACSKSDDSLSKEDFTWSLNSVDYRAGTGAAAVSPPGSSFVTIDGYTNGVSQLQINLENCTKPGTYIAEKPGMLPATAYVFLQIGDQIYNTEYNVGTEKVVINITKLSPGNIQGNINGTVHLVTASGGGPAYSLKGAFNLKLWR